MEALDPAPALAPHELGVVVEVVAADPTQAEVICTLPPAIFSTPACLR